MKKIAFTTSALLFAFLTNAQCDSLMSKSLNTFAISAYKQVANVKANKNFVFSPLSINFAMRMTEAGAQNQTYNEIALTINRFEDKQTVNQNVTRFLNSYEDKGDYKLKIANAVWLQKDYKLQSNYTDILQNNYLAKAQNVDFSTSKNRKRTCNTINKWVSTETNGMIKELVSPNVVSRDTRLVLTNAIYFKCNWQSQFRSSNNRTHKFHSIDGSESELNFMKQTEHLKYFENDTMKIVSLPYSSDIFQMFFLLPAQNHFNSVETALQLNSLTSIMQKMEEQQVEISIPKFKIETDIEFTNLLKQMGVIEAFSNNADFSLMTSRNDLKISQVLHKAVIEVEEKGTEAAAATAVIMNLKSAYMPQLKRFIADRPFIYFIWDSANNTMLFAGRYVMAQ